MQEAEIMDIQKTEQKSTYISYIGIMNVAACFCVIMLHTNGVYWTHPNGKLWYTSSLIECVCYWAVPIFFMITGATLFDYRERYSTRIFFIRRIQRTLVPFLFWSAVAGVVSFFEYRKEIDLNPLHFLDNAFNIRYEPIYWFFIPLFATYLCLPILSEIENKIKVCSYASVVGTLFLGLLPLVCSLLHLTYPDSLTPPVISGYVVFIFIGYYLSHGEILPGMRKLIYFLGAAGLALHYFGTIFTTAPDGAISMTFKGYYNLPSILYSVAVFTFFRYHGNFLNNKRRGLELIRHLSKLSFGIYLIHNYFVKYLPVYLPIDTSSIVWRTVGAGGIYVICALIVTVMRKIPVLRVFIP